MDKKREDKLFVLYLVIIFVLTAGEHLLIRAAGIEPLSFLDWVVFAAMLIGLFGGYLAMYALAQTHLDEVLEDRA